MVDRTTQVIIGATLQSNFRTTFRAARTEVDNLSRSLANLGARRNNAGLISIRTAADNARTSLRGLRTEVGQATRSFTSLETRSARIGGALRTVNTDARSSAAGMASLNRANQAAAQSMAQATAAMRAMAQATQAQASAYRGLQSTMARPLPTPHGGGGGGGFGGRGGHGGGFGAAGTHSAMHLGLGAVGAGIVGGRALHEMWKESAGYAHELNQRTMQGWSKDEIKDLERNAREASRRVGTISQRELLKIGGDLGYALNDRKDAAPALGAVAESIAVMRSTGMKGDIEANAFGMVKALEQMGKAQSPAELGRYMREMTAASVSTGGKVAGTDFLAYTNRSKGAAQFQSEKFLTSIAPTIIQEMGGSQAGNAIAMFNSALTGGRMTNEARDTLNAMGLGATPSDGSTRATAGGAGWMGRRHTHGGGSGTAQQGKFMAKDAALLQSDPHAWMQKYFVPGLKAIGVDMGHLKQGDDLRIGEVLSRSFSNASARRAAAIFLTQDTRITKDAVKIAEALKAATLDNLKGDPEYQLQRVGTSWANLMATVGNNSGNMAFFGRSLSSIANGLDTISAMDPRALGMLTQIGAVMVGLPTAAYAAGAAFRFLGGGMRELLVIARSPLFLGIAVAGYLIYKNWDWVKGFASGALPGLTKGLNSVGAAFDGLVSGSEAVLRFFGLIADPTKTAAENLDAGAKAGERFGTFLKYAVPALTGMVVGRTLITVANGFYAMAAGINAAQVAAGGGALGALIRALPQIAALTGGYLLGKKLGDATIGPYDPFHKKGSTAHDDQYTTGPDGSITFERKGPPPTRPAPAPERGFWGRLFNRSSYDGGPVGGTTRGAMFDPYGNQSENWRSMFRFASYEGGDFGGGGYSDIGQGYGGGGGSRIGGGGGFQGRGHGGIGFDDGKRLAGQGPVSGDAGKRGLRAMARLVAHGWTPEAAATAVGQAMQESKVRSDGPLGDTKRFGFGDDAAHGMFQWRGQRFRNLKAFATGRGKDWKDFDTQIDFFDAEARRSYHGEEWKKQTDLYKGNIYGKRFEGYGDNSFGIRLGNAHSLMQAYRNGAPAVPREVAGGGGSVPPLVGGHTDIPGRLAQLQRSGVLSKSQCVTLARAYVGDTGSVTTWRRGQDASGGGLVPGTPVATFLDAAGRQSDRYAGGGVGTMGANRDHAAVFENYIRDTTGKIIGMHVAETYKRLGGRVAQKDYMFGKGSGESNGSNYAAIMRADGSYLGGENNPMTQASRAAIAAAAAHRAQTKSVSTHTTHAPITIHAQPHHDEETIATLAAQKVHEAANHSPGREMRSSFSDYLAG